MLDANGNNILQACYKGSLYEVEEAIKSGFNVNQKDADGETMLMASCLGGKSKIAEYLIKSGAKVNERDKIGRNALTYVLIECRDLDEGDRFSQSLNSQISDARLRVSPTDYNETIEILLKNGTDPNMADNEGMTALHRLATKKGISNKIYLFDLLLKNKGDINKKNSSGQTVLGVLSSSSISFFGSSDSSDKETIAFLVSKGAIK